MKDVSVIIVEYNSFDLARDALESLRILKPYFNYESIIVSNSIYPEAERKRISASFGDSMVIFNEDNVGFAKANNEAIRHASGKYLLFINPDSKLSGSGLIETIKFMEENPEAGMAGPIIRDGGGGIQDSCRKFMTIRRFLMRNMQRLLGLSSGSILDYGGSSNRRTVDWISGACMLVRRKAIDQVGMMDERFFMYIEDMDWCRRFWGAGWQVWYDPYWQVEHNASRASTSTFRVTNRLMWIHLQSYGKYFLKWFGKPIKTLQLSIESGKPEESRK